MSVDTIKDIAATYALSTINWQGDPCVPQQLRWDGLNCSIRDISFIISAFVLCFFLSVLWFYLCALFPKQRWYKHVNEKTQTQTLRTIIA